MAADLARLLGIDVERVRRDEYVVAPAVDAAIRILPSAQHVVWQGPWGDDAAAATLVEEAVERSRGTRGVTMRPPAARVDPRFREALLAHGFRYLGERIEFKTPVEELPDDAGSPLSWKSMDVVGREVATRMLAATAEGDPHGHTEHEQPERAFEDFLAATKLNCEPTCVQVGYGDSDAPVAFCCAQVASHDGWSRITYMGLVPAARGKGLGKWVHRHGFRMLRDQGGTLYHGGTAADNPGMLRLFREHGCTEFARLAEFELDFER